MNRPRGRVSDETSGLGFWIEHEVVLDSDTLAVFGWLRIQHQFWLDCRGDIVIVVWVAWEVQLRGE